MSIFNLFSKKNKEVSATSNSLPPKPSLWGNFSKIFIGKSTIDEEALDKLEELLLTADVGIDTTLKIIRQLEARVARDKYLNIAELENILKQEILSIITIKQQSTVSITLPHVILVVGVNGVGKTTTIGKLAALYKKAGKKVILGAADTFRAAAVDQLKIWGHRVDIPVVANDINADPSSVAYTTIEKAIQIKADIAIIDTAGRLHTKVHLMHELSKIKRTIAKLIPEAPQDIFLVLDATTGQNAFVQTQAFSQATSLTGLIITKLDGTAKGGVVIGIIDKYHIPIRYIGIGERIEDIHPFDEKIFIKDLFETK